MTESIEAIQQLDQIFAYSIQAAYTGSPDGTLKLQCSNDYSPEFGTGTWTDIADSSNSISGAGSSTWNVTSSNYAWVKFVFTFSSGSGTLNVHFFGRGF
jgi:hypothetical protein